MISYDTQPALGVLPVKQQIRVIMRGGAGLLGQPVMLDLARGDPDTTDSIVGSPNSSLVNVKAIAGSAVIKYGLVAVLDQALSDNQTGYATVRGKARMLVKKSSGSVTYGDPIILEDALAAGQATLADNARVVALSMGALTTPTTAALVDVLFNGIEGVSTYTG